MANVDDFIKRVNNLNAKDLIVKAASSNTEELADQNVINLDSGLLSTGKNISPKYETDAYANFKKSIGSKVSPTPNLKLTGDFHSGVFAKSQGDKIMFGSSDEKEGKLQDKYSADIFGVTQEQLISQIDSDIVKLIDLKLSI